MEHFLFKICIKSEGTQKNSRSSPCQATWSDVPQWKEVGAAGVQRGVWECGAQSWHPAAGLRAPWRAPSFLKPLPHSDLTEAATASGPFFHLNNAFALLPFLPQLRQNTQGSERSLPQGCSSIMKISSANRLINLIRRISLEESD